MNWKLFGVAILVLMGVLLWRYHFKYDFTNSNDRYTDTNVRRLRAPRRVEHVVYINLAERTDRKKAVEKELWNMGWTATRIDAVKHRVGPIGCSLSHIRALEYAQSQRWPHVLICEDDLQFNRSPDQIHAQLEELLKRESDWDVVLFGAHVHRIEKRWPGCVRVLNGNLAHAYLVCRAYYPTLLRNFRTGAQRYRKEPTANSKYALDIFWNTLQERDLWIMPDPIIAYQRSSYSNNVHSRVEHVHSIDAALAALQ